MGCDLGISSQMRCTMQYACIEVALALQLSLMRNAPVLMFCL